jgi:hypothetical protein
MQKFIIRKTNQGWLCKELINDQPNPQVFELFGTYELPLPFTPAAHQNTVIESLLSRNPNAIVEVLV